MTWADWLITVGVILCWATFAARVIVETREDRR